jgi:hypothetical protein
MIPALAESTLMAPDLISARGQPFVRGNGTLEVVVFLAGNEALVNQAN